MNKIIPITLGAVIAIAMVFALAPMDYASTAHVSTPSTATVTSASIVDDTIGPADIAGSTAAASLFRVERAAVTDNLVVATTTHTPSVVSSALVTCTAEGVANAAITDGVMTLTDNNAGSTIQGQAGRNISEVVAAADFWSTSQTWMVTGITAAAVVFTCTITGTGVVAADDLTGNEIVAIIVPE